MKDLEKEERRVPHIDIELDKSKYEEFTERHKLSRCIAKNNRGRKYLQGTLGSMHTRCAVFAPSLSGAILLLRPEFPWAVIGY
jgi:hypothetical protein